MRQGNKGFCADRKAIVSLIVELIEHDPQVRGAVMQAA
jgi:hypothetical protein